MFVRLTKHILHCISTANYSPLTSITSMQPCAIANQRLTLHAAAQNVFSCLPGRCSVPNRQAACPCPHQHGTSHHTATAMSATRVVEQQLFFKAGQNNAVPGDGGSNSVDVHRYRSAQAQLHAATPAEPIFATGARLTAAAQLAWKQVLEPGDVVVDATCGNGHDTLALAEAVGPYGLVYAVDVQAEALAATRERLTSALAASSRPEVQYVQQCHSRLQEFVGSSCAKVVVFNLGFLPGAINKGATATDAQTTTLAMESALEVVCPGAVEVSLLSAAVTPARSGLISVLAYTNHLGGLQEYQAVHKLVSELKASYWVSSEVRMLNRATAPVLMTVWRRPNLLPWDLQQR